MPRIADGPPQRRADVQSTAQETDAKRDADPEAKPARDVDEANADADPDYEEGLMPRSYFMRIVRNKKAHWKRRDAAAKLLMPYEHSRLSPIAPPDNQESDRQRRYKETKDSVVRKIAEFKAELANQVPDEDDG